MSNNAPGTDTTSGDASPPYRGPHDWNHLQGVQVTTKRSTLTWYPEVGKLHVSHPWRDKASGELHFTKTVVLDASDLSNHPEVLQVMIGFLAQATKVGPASQQPKLL